MNKVFIIGNLTRDPEVRTTGAGATVCSFDVAVQRRHAGQDGNLHTYFYRVNAWRGLGESCHKFLSKGKKVAVVGDLHPGIYTAKDGAARLALDVSADEIEFLSPRSDARDIGE